jgi:UDP-N-acetylglucosamine 4,6-dehydratase
MSINSFYNNKTILVTGGTGSFGKQFIKFILKNFKPKKIIIFSRDELKQYNFKQEIGEKKALRYFLGDIRDFDRLELATKDVDIIVHAAALKQVDTAEYNPFEYIKTNIIGAENIIRAVLKNKVRRVIALSTDKAVDPINLYGSTKLASDKLFIAANNLIGKDNINFSVVRYGNVISSRGSVIPKFQELIKKKNPFIPITHEEMTRFFITLEESAIFVSRCVYMMLGGETFIPKLYSIKILDLANSMKLKSQKIKIVGIRPGEKIHEVLISSESQSKIVEFKNHFVVEPSIIFFKKKNYLINNLKERGKLIKKQFKYSSDNNSKMLNKTGINNFLIKNVNTIF